MERQDEHNSSGGGRCFLEGVLRGKLHGCLVPFVGCLADILQPFLFCAQNPMFAHNVGTRIKKLNSELATIRKDVADFKFNIDLGSYEERRRSPTSLGSASFPRLQNKLLVQSDLVGDQIEKNTEKLMQELIAGHGSSSTVKVVAIVGMGGIGKTTLAKKVLASEAIKEEFKPIWLPVTQQVDNVDQLRRAISRAGENPGDNMDEDTLTETLTDTLSKKKFLLVLDDVWDHQVWELLLRVPVLVAGERQPGSRVLVTSRMENVVKMMEASSILLVNKLDDDDAWCLLKKHASKSSVGVESDLDVLKAIGMKIVEKCDGLPLAIKVLGGLLNTKCHNKHNWETILHKNLGWKKDGPLEELNYSVGLSYDDLSPELKQCFLYYSLLPKGSGFAKDVVVSMWISQGFVQHDGSSELIQTDLEEIGNEYHQGLIARNLLEPDDSTWSKWDYTLHDVVRSFAQFMAKEEAFVVHKDQADIGNLLPENKKIRHLSIESIDSKLEWTIPENQETLTLRTLLIGCEIKYGGSLAKFSYLRVLDIRSNKFDWLVDSLCELKHLSYLSFSNAIISRLPGDIHKMRFLQHIHLDRCTKLNQLPSSITKLACLRYLSLAGSNVDVIPRGFSGLTNLRSLYGFPVKMDGDWCNLEELGALSHLRRLGIQNLENVPSSSIAKRAKISEKTSLEYLELNFYRDEKKMVDDEVRQIGPDQQRRIKDVFDELCPPPELETLMICGYFGHRLPNWLEYPAETTFESSKIILLGNITYCTQLPNAWCSIHGLEELLINCAPAIKHVGPEFQKRGDGGVAFPCLRKLVLSGLSGWKKWEWEEEQSKVAMPALEYLQLTDCKLTHLPPGLASAHRYNLRSVHLENLSLLHYVENFPSVVELHVYNCPELKRISGLSRLQVVYVEHCPKLKVVDGMELDDQ